MFFLNSEKKKELRVKLLCHHKRLSMWILKTSFKKSFGFQRKKGRMEITKTPMAINKTFFGIALQAKRNISIKGNVCFNAIPKPNDKPENIMFFLSLK